MTGEIALICAGVAFVSSLVTAIVASRLRKREERSRWNQELGARYAAAQSTGMQHAQALAQQYAVAFLQVFFAPDKACIRFFIPANCSVMAGRGSNCDIVIYDPSISRQHCLFRSDDRAVYLVDLGTRAGVILVRDKHDKQVEVPAGTERRLKSGDCLQIGKATILFHQLERRPPAA